MSFHILPNTNRKKKTKTKKHACCCCCLFVFSCRQVQWKEDTNLNCFQLTKSKKINCFLIASLLHDKIHVLPIIVFVVLV